jgi:tetratricopeptide (TPR) repeat protein
MLATKNRGAWWRVGTAATWAAWLCVACTPAGPRALLDGERLVREGRPAQAIPRLERAARLLPKDARAWNHLGLAYHDAGRLDDAQRAYTQATVLDRTLSAARFNLGCVLFERGDAEGAARELGAYLTGQPGSEPAWLMLATAQLRARQADAAERSFLQALKLNRRSAESHNGLGLVQVQRRRYPEAVQQFNAALEFQADYAPALLNSAIVAHQFLNNRTVALQRYRAALALPAPPHADVLRRIVAQLEAETRPQPVTPRPGSSDAAAAQAPPGTPAPRPATPPSRPAASGPATNLASSTDVGRRPTTATPPRVRPAVTQAPPAEVSTPAVTPPAPTGSVDTATKPAPVAIASEVETAGGLPVPRYTYRRPPAPRPGDRGAAERLMENGGREHDQNRLTEAKELYEKAIQADPAYFDAHYNLSVAAYESGDLAKAMSASETALTIEPESLKARFNFAAALERAGYPRDAANELERLIARHPSEMRIRLKLGNLYAQQLREPARAREHYLKLLELDPQHAQAMGIRLWLEANP